MAARAARPTKPQPTDEYDLRNIVSAIDYLNAFRRTTELGFPPGQEIALQSYDNDTDNYTRPAGTLTYGPDDSTWSFLPAQV